jgi:predicted Zn-dependent peptidase
MKNIREDKGYTYGIRSGWVAGKHTGYLIISSQVGNEYAENTIDEIRKEMAKLRVDLCSTEEMDLVKNYMLGSSISQRETPFQLGSLIRFSIIHEVGFDRLNQKYANILNLTSYDVLKLASEYLKPDDLLEVVCGTPI